MKVLHIINSLATGGAEKLIVESLPLLQKSGIEVDLFLLKTDNYPFENLLRNNLQFTIYNSQFNSVYNPLHIFSIIPIIKKYEVIHVHLFPSLYWVSLAKLLSFSKTKLVFTEHSTSNRRMENVFFKPFDKLIYSQYSKIITISDKVDFAIKESLQYADNKFVMIKNGINLTAIQNAKPIKDTFFEGLKKNKIIIQVSSFQYPKDQFTVIKALKLLPENVVLLLVGDGIDKQKVENFVDELGLKNRVFFLGIRMDVPQLLKSADIVVLSSHHEGLSLSSVEGLASGKPFVASNVPGLTEVVENAGLLFEDCNENELANHINNLLNNENYYNEISQKCVERANDFDIEKMIVYTIKLYKSL